MRLSIKNNIFVTGATGFIGTQIVRRLIKDSKNNLIILVRRNGHLNAEYRLFRAWWEWPELLDAIGKQIELIEGDVAFNKLGLDENTYNKLAHKITHIIHAAADTRLGPLDILRKTNVKGTANVLELARKVNKSNSNFFRLIHVSTAYVAGRCDGAISEETLNHEFGFSSDYEQTKYEGEHLVRESMDELPISIIRPSMVIGDSNTGEIKTFNTLYYPLRLYLTEKMKIFPSSSKLRANFVPVDYVVHAITTLMFNPDAEGMTFHITTPEDSIPTLGELTIFVRNWAEKKLGIKLAYPIFLPIPLRIIQFFLSLKRRLQSKERRITSALLSLSPYFNKEQRFLRKNTDRLLGRYQIDWQKILSPILDYATSMSFFHRSDRTVHEQIIFRLSSKSRPITYYDIVDDRIIKYSPIEMKKAMLVAVNAIKSMDIRPGDRVAIIGQNSTRYLIIDVAIGLTGAVSVPIYYTSPPQDITSILEDSSSRLLFLGEPKLLERINEVSFKHPIVSFCRCPIPSQLTHKVKSWEEFLKVGESKNTIINAPVILKDIASLRYTSGTTGINKGAIFRHHHLRWMAESLISLIPWKSRHRESFYLSFLPMNHVVEGILGTYSPYYAPTSLNIYFLEDFKNLRKFLPKVRPSIFFAVPRIYEKIWEGLRKWRLYQYYIKSEKAFLKKLLKNIIKKLSLRKAGLGRCSYLIVGSASSDEEILSDFHELGIEVHNAYGLTEAPLVTINRVNKNRIGTVGTVLPKTRIKINTDGELMVKGPQVTSGYFGNKTSQPFKEGWLLTGDLGSLTSDNYLVLLGRKSELIKTSYGKFIHPVKIEAMLRNIQEVFDALMIGEGKPYCIALIWVNRKLFDNSLIGYLDGKIEKINENLSHPEQIKRWAILSNDLSIEKGDLTPNLKLKRNFISNKYSEIINSIYDGKESIKGTLHIGNSKK